MIQQTAHFFLTVVSNSLRFDEKDRKNLIVGIIAKKIPPFISIICIIIEQFLRHEMMKSLQEPIVMKVKILQNNTLNHILFIIRKPGSVRLRSSPSAEAEVRARQCPHVGHPEANWRHSSSRAISFC
jgi:hypothetical protein